MLMEKDLVAASSIGRSLKKKNWFFAPYVYD